MMALDDLPVVRCVLTLPQSGVWVADVEVVTTSMVTATQSPSLPSEGSAATLTIDSQTFKATVIRADDRINGALSARLVGGLAGGYAGNVAPTNLSGASASSIASTLLSSLGESLSTTLSAQSVLQSRLPAWQAFGDRTLAEEMTQLAQALGCSWRVDPATGNAFFVVDQFSSAATMPTNGVVEEVSEAGFSTWVCPALDQLPLPGTLDGAGGNQIVEVELDIDESMTRVQLRSASLSSLLSNPSTSRGIENGVSYGGQVTAQNGDGTLNINPDIQSLKGRSGLASVRVMSGAGMTAQITAGTRVTFIFQNGQPNLPLVVQVSPTPLPQSVTINAQSLVELGDASDFVALASPTDENFTKLVSAITSVTPATVETGLIALIAKLNSTVFPPPVGVPSVAATKVKGS